MIRRPLPLRRRQRRLRPLRRPGLQGLPVNVLIPNVLTVLALCAGLTSIRFAIGGEWREAVLAIVAAAVLDGLDGRIARLLNGQSRFGAELDSLSDMISFGIAPALLLYLWALQGLGGPGFAPCLVFSVCAALRLARFNSALDMDLPPYAKAYFTGVPAPAGAGLAILPVIGAFATGADVSAHPLLVGAWTVAVGGLMISRLPTFSAKGAKVPPWAVAPVLLAAGLIAAALVGAPWPTLTALGLVYLATLPVAFLRYRARARAWEAQRGGEQPVVARIVPAPEPRAEDG
jgi:CDP-diacylglycerol--serine O-phosphatidyltransferase